MVFFAGPVWEKGIKIEGSITSGFVWVTTGVETTFGLTCGAETTFGLTWVTGAGAWVTGTEATFGLT